MKLIILFIFLFVFISCKKDAYIPLPSVVPSVMTDSRDGQKYKIVKLGQQWWMAENLNYNNNRILSFYYDNDSVKYSKIYGRLYYWATAMADQPSSSNNPSNVQGISPPGWHIPSDAEWTELEMFLIANRFTGDDLKETGSEHWQPSNTGTDRTFFHAVPAGTCFDYNRLIYANINGYTNFLSSTIDTATGGVWGRGLDFDKPNIIRNPIGLQNAWSVRCVKDN